MVEFSEMEADVVQAACDLVTAEEGGKYGPMGPVIKKCKEVLYVAVCDLQSESDGRWEMPSFVKTEVRS